MKILIIEDQPPMRRNIALLLEMEGFAVATAENGAKGVETAKREKPDLIVCDVMMPELDGYGVVQALRAETEFAATPFIFLSAKAMATMEFLQQEWINNGNFMDLGDERDPNVGLQEDGATFTIPQHPVRRRIRDIQTFNVLRGGEYFFMPSVSALRWIGDLRPPSGPR